MAIDIEDGTDNPKRYDAVIDNRDPGTTWIWLEGTGDYVEVSPVELVENMIENCREWILAEQGVTEEALESALKTLRQAVDPKPHHIVHPDTRTFDPDPYW